MDAYYYKNDEGTDIEITDIPADLKELADKWHENLVEKCCELDDDLMMQYLEGEEPSIADMKAALRKGTIANEAVPVFCGSAYKTRVFRRCSMALSSTCLLLRISLISQVQTKMVTR